LLSFPVFYRVQYLLAQAIQIDQQYANIEKVDNYRSIIGWYSPIIKTLPSNGLYFKKEV
jgi:hypothetical protein